jgi:hypothetical protein
MARKKVTTVTEEDVPEGVDYKKMHDQDISEVVSDATKPEPPEDNAVEKKAKEIPKKDDEEVDVELEELDTEALKKEAAAEAKKQVIEALQDKPKEEVDEYEAWAKKVFDETGKQPNWKQAAEFIKENAKREIRAEEEAKAKEEEDKKATQAEEEKKVTSDWNAFIDRELDDLYAESKLPKIKDANSATDPGVVARKALFQTMLDVNTKLQSEGKPIEYSIYKIFHKYYKAPNRQPAGADAPIAGGTGGNAAPEDKVSYQELKKPWHSFLSDLVKK